MKLFRVLVAALAVIVAVIVQISVLSEFSWRGVVPNLVLLIVVAAGLVRGASFAMVVGFFAGLVLDLAPPADHLLGRWALALVLVGYFASRVRPDQKLRLIALMGTVAAASFIGTSVFALSGVLLGDTSLAVPTLLRVIALSVLVDVILTPIVVPLMIRLLRRGDDDSRARRAARGGALVGAAR